MWFARDTPGFFMNLLQKISMLTACLGQGVKYFVSRPLRRLRLRHRVLEKRVSFFIPASCSNEKGFLAPGGELVIHIHRLGGYEY
jgi:hypothetical protein